MTSRFASSGPAAAGTGAIIALAALIAAPHPASAANGRSHREAHRAAEAEAPRTAGPPLLAIVSLADQQVTIYDADGWVLRAPVSTGMKGRETPSGVFSVIQKERDHYSNIYDDAYMPNMQRITWSGIALHGGVLPGHAASHGCIRMPYGFAERLFPLTNLGLRVIVAPGDPAPVEIADPALPVPKPDDGHAAALAAAAVDAGRKADDAKSAAASAARDAARASTDFRKLDSLTKRAEAERAAAAKALARAASDAAKARDQDAVQKADAKVAALQPRWDAANNEQQKTADAVAPARDAAAAAVSARDDAAAAAREAARALRPVSIFISRKMQKLYVRRGFEPVFDAPVTIRDPDRPIGTHVFTVMAKTDAGVRWSAVTLTDGQPRLAEAQTSAPEGSRDAAPVAADASAAKDALERVTIPPEVLARVAPGIAPRASIIISDEALSQETGKGTEFVAVLSNEPQGGLSMRHRAPASGHRYVYPSYSYPRDDRYFYGRSPFGGGFFRW